MNIREELARRVLIFDGGMGTMLQAAGLPAGREPELWNLERPEAVKDVHRRYLSAGADIVTTNTFGANAVKLSGRPVEELAAAGVTLARQAVAEHGGGFVALDLGPTGRLLRPMGDLPFEEAVAAYVPAVRAGAAAGADLVLIETMSDLYEAKAAVLAAKEHCDLPIFVSVVLDEGGRMLTGGDLASAVALLEGLGVDAVGLNCGLGPEQMAALFPELYALTSLPVFIQPNAGLPECVDGCTHFRVGSRDFAAAMAELVRSGLRMAGGCCGTTPEHIRALSDACRDLPALPVASKRRTWVSSYARAVVFGEDPVLIGERINPTGKPRLKEALRAGDMDYVLRLAVEQQEKGAQVLDVNVGLPEVDETALLLRAVEELQAVTDLPLQLDSSSPDALEAAMRRYNGRPLVNSVNGKAESMAALFPLLKKYGGVAIALTLDEDGIPATAEGRLAIARRIVDTAAGYGIPREDLIFDPLALTISADQSAAAVERGLKESAVAAARTALDGGKAPMELIDGALIPALDRVGAAFETGKLYLPQLLMSAEAAKAVFELLREALSTGGALPAPKAKVVLATVKGDVHDIGKNIVKVLLENYGYQVVDLGKDVSPRAVADAVVGEHAALCGLSALMTTTVGAMEETIALLRREAPWCRVMAGGAVLTADYARRIGADFYGKDAMSDVRYADSVLETP